MFRRTKILVLITLILFSASTIAVPTHKAHAGVAVVAVVNGEAGKAVGFGLGAVASLGIAYMSLMSGALNDQADKDSAVFFAWVFLIGAVVLLDEDQGNLGFASLTPDQADQIGLTDEEYRSYDINLDELNILLENARQDFAYSGLSYRRCFEGVGCFLDTMERSTKYNSSSRGKPGC